MRQDRERADELTRKIEQARATDISEQGQAAAPCQAGNARRAGRWEVVGDVKLPSRDRTTA